MNKKGFTLVELLAILVFLGIIITVTMPALVESNRVAKINEQKDFDEMISTACETYISAITNETEKQNFEETKELSKTVGEFINNGYLKGNVVNPKTSKKISDETYINIIIIKNENGEIKCKYGE